MISQRIRLHVNTTTKKIGVDVLTAATPHLLKPSATQFEVALFEDDASDIKDITGIDQLTLSVKAKDPRTGLSVMQQTLAVADLNTALTAEEWETNAPDMCHALFEFTATETNVELDADEVEFYIVIAGLTGDVPAKEIPFGNGALMIEESGAFDEPPAEITDAEFYTKAQSDARYLLAADLSAKQDVITGGASTITSANLTVSRALTSNGSGKVAVSAVTSTELGHLSGVTSALQTQLDGKLSTLTGAATTIASANLTASRALLSNSSGKVAVSTVTETELGYLSGATSAIQTQLNAKLSLAGGTMSGALTLSGAPSSNLHAATKLYVDTAVANLVASSPGALDTLNELAAALGNDAAFSTTVTTSIATKVPLAGGTMTGLLTLSGAPSSSLHAATKAYADLMVPLAGGTMSGLLTLSGAPSSGLHATTKTYVDAADALKLNLTGGTLSGALQFSGTTNAGMRVNNLTSAQITALGALADGYVVYDTTLEKFRYREASTWKEFGSGGGSGGGSWLISTGVPDNGDGSDGDFNIDDANGTIYFKASGTWSVLVAARLPKSGGALTGALQFGSGLTPSIDWTADGYDIRADSDSWRVCTSGTPIFEVAGTTHATAPFGDVNFTGSIWIAGSRILTGQQAAIPDDSVVGGSATSGGYGFVSSAEFNTHMSSVGALNARVNTILAMLRTHGLIAT